MAMLPHSSSCTCHLGRALLAYGILFAVGTAGQAGESPPLAAMADAFLRENMPAKDRDL